MNKKAVVLFSGGLDSTLAICMMKEQGIEVEALTFQTLFRCCKSTAKQTAHQLGINFTMLPVGDDYLEVIRRPKYGYGRAVNPCIDCRIYMFRTAKTFMEKTGASFIVSGEVVGQRPMSQKMSDFKKIEAETGLEGLILRPLSAQLLPITEPERAGIVDRRKFFAIQGRTRQKILALAEGYGIEDPQDGSSGCALTQPPFARKVKDLFQYHANCVRWEYEILGVGRHFRLDPEAKIVVGRNEPQNSYLESLRPAGTTIVSCENFNGPTALLIGPKTEERLQKSAAVLLYYAQKPLPESCEFNIVGDGGHEVLRTNVPADEKMMEAIRIV